MNLINNLSGPFALMLLSHSFDVTFSMVCNEMNCGFTTYLHVMKFKVFLVDKIIQ